MQNFHAARVVDPDKFEKLRYKNIAEGIDIVVGNLKGETKTTIQAYRFDKEKFTVQGAIAWLKEHDIDYIAFEAAKSVLSAKPEKKGKDLIIPFVKDGTEAFDDQGNKYLITAEALDADFKTWEGGIVTVNHKIKERGEIAEVWREKPFVYGRFTGLSDEALEVIFSPAYRGVSQESEPKEIDGKDVTRLQGTGCTFVIYPEIPACSLNDGCGKIDIASIIKSIEGDGMDLEDVKKAIEYIKNNPGKVSDDVKRELYNAIEKLDRKGFFKDMMHDLEKNPEMMDEDMRDMVGRMMNSIKSLKSNFSLNSQNQNSQIKNTGGTESNMTGEEISAEALGKTKSENEALKKQNEALTSENAGLKSQLTEKERLLSERDKQLAEKDKLLSSKETELKSIQDKLPEMVNATIEARQKYDLTVTDLRSIAPKDKVDEFLIGKPSLESIQTMIKMVRSIGGKPPEAGAGHGDGGNISQSSQNLQSAIKSINSKFLGAPKQNAQGGN